MDAHWRRHLYLCPVVLGLAALLLASCGDGGTNQQDQPADERQDQLSYLDADSALWLVNADGSDRRKLADDATCGRFSKIDWSPTGHRLVCQSQDHRFVVRDADGTVVGDVTVPDLLSIEWSPNGEAFLYWVSDNLEVDQRIGEVRYELFLADDSGELLAELGPWDTSGIRPGQAYAGFTLWSPDGNQLAYRTADTEQARIYWLDTGEERTLNEDYHPLGWALEGTALLVAANSAAPRFVDTLPEYEVLAIDLEGRELARFPELNNGVQFWTSPDGTNAAYLTRGQRDDGLPGLGVIDFRTGEARPIPDSLITYGSDHIPKEFVTFSGDGEYVLWNTGDGAGYRARIDGSGLEKLFDVDEVFFEWSDSAAAVAHSHIDLDERVVRLSVTTADGRATYQIDERPIDSGSASPFRLSWRAVSR